MLGDPRRHLLIQGLGGRDVNRLQPALEHQLLGMSTLARPRAPQDQGQAGQGSSVGDGHARALPVKRTRRVLAELLPLGKLRSAAAIRSVLVRACAWLAATFPPEGARAVAVCLLMRLCAGAPAGRSEQ